MEFTRILLVSALVMFVLATVLARPHASSGTENELADIASELTHTLREVVDIMESNKPRRRRRMVHFHIGRAHHHPRNYPRFRRRRYRKQRGGRNADISDH
ncbi:hypothetical protein V1264_010268 [Littorina saxatilis]|uniref:Uncharacterized protein n=1 Tax=Littorina saxatilis TaxID=31220 RepID=A0AAN9AP35_9CAEN